MQNASYRPSDSEIAQLMSILQMPGYAILQKIMVGQVDQFQVDLLNVDPCDKEYDSKVRTHHLLALSGGMFYQRVTDTVATYVREFSDKRDQKQVLPDMTEETFG